MNSSEDAGVLANKTVERMHRCHGQPGGVFSGHETIGGIGRVVNTAADVAIVDSLPVIEPSVNALLANLCRTKPWYRNV